VTSLRRSALRLVGAALLAATGAIHLDLYLTGYQSIPTIGSLFLLQVSAVFSLAAAVLATGNRLIAATGAALALATLGAYLQSVWVGVFGFKEIRSTAGIVAGVIEVSAFAALAALAVAPATPGQRGQARQTAIESGPLRRLQAGGPAAGLAVAAISIAALVVFGISLAHAHGPAATSASGGTMLKTAKIDGVTVLTNARGFTVYWFVPDTPVKSNCYGICVGYWPPVTGTPSLSPGVRGKLSAIERHDGTTQITYNGHPLYTYVGDTAPGQAFGNNLNLNGGLWHQMTVSG